MTYKQSYQVESFEKIDKKSISLALNTIDTHKGFLTEKMKLINIYNYYTKKMLSIWQQPKLINDATLIELQSILEMTIISIKNYIIDFKDKKPFLVLYNDFYELANKVESFYQKQKAAVPSA